MLENLNHHPMQCGSRVSHLQKPFTCPVGSHGLGRDPCNQPLTCPSPASFVSSASSIVLSSSEMDADSILSFLVSRRQIQANPPAAQLKSLIDACLATDSTLALSKQDERHWFCPKQKDALITKVATYLIFLFSYNRTGQVEEWVKTLEKVVLKCPKCARGFCSARVEFKST